MRPSILGFFTVGMTTLSMLSVSCVLYSAGSGVKRVLVVLSGLRWSWFCCVHEAISCKYGCSFACAILQSSTPSSFKLRCKREETKFAFVHCCFI